MIVFRGESFTELSLGVVVVVEVERKGADRGEGVGVGGGEGGLKGEGAIDSTAGKSRGS